MLTVASTGRHQAEFERSQILGVGSFHRSASHRVVKTVSLENRFLPIVPLRLQLDENGRNHKFADHPQESLQGFSSETPKIFGERQKKGKIGGCHSRKGLVSQKWVCRKVCRNLGYGVVWARGCELPEVGSGGGLARDTSWR